VIEVKNGDIAGCFPALVRIGQTKIPARAAYRVSRLIAKLRAELTAFEEARIALVKGLGVEQADKPGTWDIPAEKRQEYDEQLEAIAGDLVRVDYDPLPLSIFGDAPLAPLDIASAERFFVDDTEPKAA
jgi:hypothetical protein